GELGRYAFVTADPFRWLRARGRQVWLDGTVRQVDPFAVVADQLSRFRTETVAGLPPFQGGAAGLFGYDLRHHLERLPRFRCDEFQVPDLALGLYDWVIAFDHAQGCAWLMATGLPEPDRPRQRQRAARRLRAVRCWLARPPQRTASSANGAPIALAASHPIGHPAGMLSSFHPQPHPPPTPPPPPYR